MTPKNGKRTSTLFSKLRHFVFLVGLAILVGFVIRSFLFQPFYVPTPSMAPNLVRGDYIIASKYRYGYGRFSTPPFELPIKNKPIFAKQPKRGDIVVFRLEGDRQYYIKRLVGLPGDKIQLKDGQVFINSSPAKLQILSETAHAHENGQFIKARRYLEVFPEGDNAHIVFDSITGAQADTTGEYIVPDGHYFFLGDNRDQSLDSRFERVAGGIGYVPQRNLVGKAEFILISYDQNFNLFRPSTWGGVRRNRIFRGLR